MNIKVRYKKEYFDITNTETGETKKSTDYTISGEIEYYNDDWQATSIDPKSGESIPMVIAKFWMFPNQWVHFQNMLIQGEKESRVEIKWAME